MKTNCKEKQKPEYKLHKHNNASATSSFFSSKLELPAPWNLYPKKAWIQAFPERQYSKQR